MIFAEWKPLDELVEKLSSHKKVLLAGCATCVAECSAGGEKEVETLAPLLQMGLQKQGYHVEIAQSLFRSNNGSASALFTQEKPLSLQYRKSLSYGTSG